MSKKEEELKADELIGSIINEFGEITLTEDGRNEIVFSAPIFTPPQDADEQEDISVSFREVNTTTGEKKVGVVSKLELEKLKQSDESEK